MFTTHQECGAFAQPPEGRRRTRVAAVGCDHLAPVFENDMLSSRVYVEAVTPLEPNQFNGGGALVDLRVLVHATRGPDATLAGQSQSADVLDWRVVCLMA